MPKKRSETIDQENPFQPDELFFSITDQKGIILAGNDVFIRIAEYSKDELIGANHNIIRHPDMPRAVFKLLWDTIKAGKSISAYVKNCAKSGRYYWVVANVYPLGDGYLSVRFKPTLPLRDAVFGVYQQMLEAEATGGMPAAAEHLMGVLKSLGFSDYEDFQQHMVYEELAHLDTLRSRDSLGKALAGSQSGPITDLVRHCDSACVGYRRLFQHLAVLRSMTTNTARQSSFLRQLAGDIKIHATNSSIAAARIGNEGRMLAAVAVELGSLIAASEESIQAAGDNATHCLALLKKCSYVICSTRILFEMLPQFAHALQREKDRSGSDVEELSSHVRSLIALITGFSSEALGYLDELDAALKKQGKWIGDIQRMTRSMNLVRSVGNIEVSRIAEQDDFRSVFARLEEDSDNTGREMKEFSEASETATKEIEMGLRLAKSLQSSENEIRRIAEFI